MTQIPLSPGGGGRAFSPTEDGATRDSMYASVGGHDTFVALVDRFYEGVVADPVLVPLYPPDDIDGARERLTLFLEQYWGGPSTYSQTRGHPRLRMRHAGFHIGPAARDAWIAHMGEALASLGLPPLQHDVMWDYLERAAHSLLNSFDD